MEKEQTQTWKWILFISIITLAITKVAEGVPGNVAMLLYIGGAFFALPLLAYVLGIKIKNMEKEEGWKLCKYSILLYFLLNLIFAIYQVYINQMDFHYSIFYPLAESWIFLAIPIYFVAYLLLGEKRNVILSGILVAIIIGNITEAGNVFGIYSIAALFPFFWYGIQWDEEKNKKNVVLKIILVIVGIVAIYFLKTYSYIFKFNTPLKFITNTMNVINGITLLSRIIVYPICLAAISLLTNIIEKIVKRIEVREVRIKEITFSQYIFGIIIAILVTPIVKYQLLYYQISRTRFFIAILLSILLSIGIPIITQKCIPNIKAIYQKWIQYKEKINQQEQEKRKAKNKNEKSKVEQKTISTSNVLIRFFNSNGIVVLLGILLFVKTGIMYLNTLCIETEWEENFILIMGSIGYVACIIIPLFFIRKNKTRMTWVIIFDLLVSALLFADDCYYNYSSNFVSVYQIGNLQYADEIGATLPNLLKIHHVLYFIDILVLVLIRFTFIKNEYKTNKVSPILATILCITLIIPGKEGFVLAKDVPWDKIEQVKRASIFGYHLQDLQKSINFEKTIPYKEKSEVLKAYQEVENYQIENQYKTSEYHGIAKGKNVIIVQLESVPQVMINREYQGTEITPNLNQFFKKNVQCTNAHMQSLSSTADSEFSAATSIFPLENGMSFSKYPAVTYPDIFHITRDKGYMTNVIHGNRGNFWNRSQAYKGFGVENTIFDDQFSKDVQRYSYYVSDDEVYKKSVEEMRKQKEKGEKFLYSIIAASSHTPFTLVGMGEEERAKLPIQQDGTTLTNYIQSVSYADAAFGRILQELKEEGLYEDSIIIVYGDHTGLGSSEEEIVQYYESIGLENRIQYKIEDTKVAMGMKIPEVERQVITKPVSKMDIKSTILDLLGIEDKFSLGSTIFGNKDYMELNNGTILTNSYYEVSNIWYDIETGEEIELDTLPKEERTKLEKIKELNTIKINISQSIPGKNLLKGMKF